jgi:hypothetical protein
MEKNGNKPHPKVRKSYECIPCQFYCYNKKDFNRHLETKKHKNLCKSDDGINEKTSEKICVICKKKYKSDSGLWKHQQKCKKIENNKEENDYKKIIMEVVDKNNELQKMIIDQYEQHTKNLEEILPKIKIGNVTNNTTNNTTHNTTNDININIFLNEYCKDALNISEFVHSLQMKVDSLENTCKIGHINNISQIFIDGLKDLDMYKRPLHCSDLHKKTLYVKDNNIWEKDDEKLRQAIVVLNEKNIQNISSFVDEDEKKNDSYSKIIVENIISEDDVDKDMEKIIKSVAKEVIIK